MTHDPSASGTDLSVEQVRRMLTQQGYAIPEIELLEVTASLNALIDGLSHMNHYGSLAHEPWPTLVGYLDTDVALALPADAGVAGAYDRGDRDAR